MSETEKKVLVMYDVRGIQNYIFRTSKLKDAIGASAIVENIIAETLREAVKRSVNKDGTFLSYDLDWCDDKEIKPFEETDKDIVVLYIGGGNAYVMMRNREIAVSISKDMSRQIIEKTYSLQLAVAIVEASDNYYDDYKALNEEMTRIKANMITSKPIGALPVMEIEIKTGYPAIGTDSLTNTLTSRESQMKKKSGDTARKDMKPEEKRMEEYITEKEVDSTLAIVHIDGNNMGLRIRELFEEHKEYGEAVNRMREISYNINNSFKTAFDEMKDYFNTYAPGVEAFSRKKNDYYLVKVITAGDDITYVCNGKIALATVEFFAKNVAERTMISEERLTAEEKAKGRDYRFSVCAGISFIGSHFPFNTGYDVAESCCENAKKAAKADTNKDNERIGNWVDFMFCRNVQTRNLEDMRKREYETRCSEQLLSRPYFIPTGEYGAGSTFAKLSEGKHSICSLKSQLDYFCDEKKIPRSQAKDLRNTYPLGEGSVDMLTNFLESRNVKLPGDGKAYYHEDGKVFASYYDALELMDMYVGLEAVEECAKEAEK